MNGGAPAPQRGTRPVPSGSRRNRRGAAGWGVRRATWRVTAGTCAPAPRSTARAGACHRRTREPAPPVRRASSRPMRWPSPGTRRGSGRVARSAGSKTSRPARGSPPCRARLGLPALRARPTTDGSRPCPTGPLPARPRVHPAADRGRRPHGHRRRAGGRAARVHRVLDRRGPGSGRVHDARCARRRRPTSSSVSPSCRRRPAPPPTLGMSAVSLAELSGGRFTLGIGASSEVIVQRWSGQRFDKPLTAVRETVEALRPMLPRRARHLGRRDRPGRRLQAARAPAGRPRPARARRAEPAVVPDGRRARGRRGVPQPARPAPRPARARRGRRGRAGGSMPDDFRVIARLFVRVTDDVPAMRAGREGRVRAVHRHQRLQQVLPLDGLRGRRPGRARRRRRQAGQAAAVTDEVVDDLFCLGTADEVAAKVAAYVDAGRDRAGARPAQLRSRAGRGHDVGRRRRVRRPALTPVPAHRRGGYCCWA